MVPPIPDQWPLSLDNKPRILATSAAMTHAQPARETAQWATAEAGTFT
jgi:hypothetical protein